MCTQWLKYLFLLHSSIWKSVCGEGPPSLICTKVLSGPVVALLATSETLEGCAGIGSDLLVAGIRKVAEEMVKFSWSNFLSISKVELKGFAIDWLWG